MLHYIGYNSLADFGSYDSYGNLKIQENLVTGASDTFSYDKLHRLVQSGITVNSVTSTIDYAYDAVGNILKKIRLLRQSGQHLELHPWDQPD